MSNKLTADDLDVIKESLKHGYLIPHEYIRKLVAENERLQSNELTRQQKNDLRLGKDVRLLMGRWDECSLLIERGKPGYPDFFYCRSSIQTSGHFPGVLYDLDEAVGRVAAVVEEQRNETRKRIADDAKEEGTDPA